MSSNPITSIGITEFVKKTFKDGGKTRPMIDWDSGAFIQFVMSMDKEAVRVIEPKMKFCKYVFVQNFTAAHVSHLKIDNSNAQWLRSGYEARTESELPVLTRWFDFPCALSPSKWLMLILYSKEQLVLEANGTEVPQDDWSLVSVIALDEPLVPPMPPITMFRNALGVEEGGNGVPLNKGEYKAAVEYWNNFAAVK